ncbi:tyrosine-type recombinase/integrase [Streptomyces sp. NPDC006365]|uniref:tyrosine-type recombinase/integrase n=1 Tax=Streptomyces sp. NPDC006365 TaxID=3364744 RepID=UPI00367EACC7
MGRPISNNPRPVPSKNCGCPLCLEKFPEPSRRKTKDHTGTWQARYTGPGGKPLSKNKDTYDEAVAFLERTRTELRQRTWIDPARSEITLCAWHELWWPTQVKQEPGELRPHDWSQSQVRDDGMWRNHITPKFGSYRLFELGWLEIQTWVNALHDENGGPLAAASVTKCFQVLDRMLNAAKLDRRLPFNPADGIKLPTIKKKHPEDRRPPTYAQLWLIRQKLPEYCHALQIVAQETGLRWGELAGLRWCNIDFTKRVIHVREVLTETRGRIRRKAYPKSDAGLRTVPLTGFAIRVLKELFAEEDHPSLNASQPSDGLCEDELVFHGRNKVSRKTHHPYRAPIRRSTFRNLWVKAIQAAGVARQTVKKVWVTVKDKVTGRKRQELKDRIDWWPDFHDQRHTYASRLHARGVPEVIAQEILGHERAGEVTWLYTHAAADYAGQVLAALEDGKPGMRRLKLVA